MGNAPHLDVEHSWRRSPLGAAFLFELGFVKIF